LTGDGGDHIGARTDARFAPSRRRLHLKKALISALVALVLFR